MSVFETSLCMARDTALSHTLEFDWIIASAFVMCRAVGHVYDLDGFERGEWIKTAEVIRVGSLISYDYIETSDCKRFLILSHECQAAKDSFAQMRKFIGINAAYFEAKRVA